MSNNNTIVPRSETTTGFRENMFFAPVTCQARCIEEEFKKSGKGNMMIERTWEIVKQPPIETDNFGAIDIIGKEMKQYSVCLYQKDGEEEGTWDMVKSRKSQGAIYQELDSLQIPHDEAIDFANPPIGCKGIIADIKVNCKPENKRAPLTDDEKKAGKKQGADLIGEDGKPIEVYRLNMYVLGLYQGQL